MAVVLLPRSRYLIEALMRLESRNCPTDDIQARQRQESYQHSASLTHLSKAIPRPPSRCNPTKAIPTRRFQDRHHGIAPLKSSQQGQSQNRYHDATPLGLFGEVTPRPPSQCRPAEPTMERYNPRQNNARCHNSHDNAA